MIPDHVTIVRRRHMARTLLRALIVLGGAWTAYEMLRDLGGLLRTPPFGAVSFWNLWPHFAGIAVSYVFVLLGIAAAILLEPALAQWIVPLPATEPACPKCGYSLRNLKSPVCPECGTKLLT